MTMAPGKKPEACLTRRPASAGAAASIAARPSAALIRTLTAGLLALTSFETCRSRAEQRSPMGERRTEGEGIRQTAIRLMSPILAAPALADPLRLNDPLSLAAPFGFAAFAMPSIIAQKTRILGAISCRKREPLKTPKCPTPGCR